MSLPNVFDTVLRFVREHKEALALTVIVGLSFFFKALSARHGLPYIDNYDEIYLVNRALRILKMGEYNPHWFGYGSLTIFLLIPVYKLVFLNLLNTGRLNNFDDIRYFDWVERNNIWRWYTSHPQFFLSGRLLMAALGAGITLATYFVAKKAFGDRNLALLAALFTACSQGLVLQSAYILPNIPATLLILLSVLLSLHIADKEPQDPGLTMLFMANGFVAGLATGVKYNGFLVVLPFLLAAYMKLRSIRPDRKLVVGFLFVILGFLAAVPHILISPDEFLKDLTYVMSDYSGGRSGNSYTFWVNLVNGSNYFALNGFKFFVCIFGVSLPVILSLLGAVQAIVRHPRKAVLLLSFAVPFFLYMTAQKLYWRDGRNYVQVIPYMAIFASYAIFTTVRWAMGLKAFAARYSNAVVALVTVLLFFSPVVGMAQWSYERYNRVDNRTLALEWIGRGLPKGARVAFDENLHFMFGELHASGLQVYVYEVDFLRHPELSGNFDYIIIGHFDFKEDQEMSKNYNDIFGRLKLVKELRGRPFTTVEPGPLSYIDTESPWVKIISVR